MALRSRLIRSIPASQSIDSRLTDLELMVELLDRDAEKRFVPIDAVFLSSRTPARCAFTMLRKEAMSMGNC
jgi:hypothetical protein